MNVLEVKNLSVYKREVGFSYSSKKILLENINFKIKKSEIVTLIGANGSGKTTLLNFIHRAFNKKNDNIVFGAKEISYVYQNNDINLDFPITVNDFIKKIDDDFTKDISSILEINNLNDKFLSELSPGEFQKVLIFRSILNKPSFIMFDEPEKGLDLKTKKSLYELIEMLKEKYNTSFLIVSHDMHYIFSNTNRILFLDRTICCQDTVHSNKNELFQYYKHRNHKDLNKNEVLQ